jgi:hypothetical protein
MSVSATLQSPDRTSASYRVLAAASVCHMLNDTMQSLFVAAYPIFRGNFHLSFTQIGALPLVFQITASRLQPLVGLYTDRKPQPYSLPFGMAISMSGFACSFLFVPYIYELTHSRWFFPLCNRNSTKQFACYRSDIFDFSDF